MPLVHALGCNVDNARGKVEFTSREKMIMLMAIGKRRGDSPFEDPPEHVLVFHDKRENVWLPGQSLWR